MTRIALLAVALLFSAPAFAQDTPTTDVDVTVEIDVTVVDDSTDALNPDQARALAVLGDSLFRADDLSGALDAYTEGFEFDTTYAKNPFGQARTYVRMRELPQAAEAYRLAIDLGDGAEGMANIVTTAREELTAVEANLAERQSAEALNAKITRATNLLNAEPVTESAAQTAYELLEETREAGYDS
jgi:tetratricopeptide (TPR) repeat protein